MHESISLAPLGTDDAEAVAALIRRAFAAQSVPTDPPASALRVSGEDIARHLLAGGGGAVRYDDGRAVASVLWERRDGGLYVSRLAVDPAWRRRGLAQALLQAAEDAARAAGQPRLHLSTRLVLDDNRRLFAACGFVETGREAHPGYAEPTFVNLEKVLA